MTIEIAADSAALRKERGAFFTPPTVTRFLARWGIRSASDAMLEPSCGDGAILDAVAERLTSLGGRVPVRAHELHPASAEDARAILAERNYPGHVVVGDFLATHVEQTFDAVLGNPPYVRYQGFSGEARAVGLGAALAQGVRLSRLSSSWAPFVIHASAFLKADGRMGLVLPAELLSSNYAQEVRDYLLRRFATVKVVLIDKQVFPGVQTEALLLLAEGSGGTDRVQFAIVRDAVDLDDVTFSTELRVREGERWTSALVSAEAMDNLAGLEATGRFAMLSDWGRLSLGAVTGNNRFFTLSPADAARRGLVPSDLVRISPAGSSHLRALTFAQEDHDRMGASGGRTLLFRPDDPSPAARAYVAYGEELGVQNAYKCRVRTPWWRTPLPEAPDLLFTYMNEGTPQLATNPANLFYLNSVHGLYLDPGRRSLGDVLALAALNTATALSAEISGRAYGGGVLKMEPREAARLLVPSHDSVRLHEAQLRELLPEARGLLLAGNLPGARARVDAVLFAGAGSKRLEVFRHAHATLSERRGTRASSRTTEGGRE